MTSVTGWDDRQQSARRLGHGGRPTVVWAQSNSSLLAARRQQSADDADYPVRFVVWAGMPHALWADFGRRFTVKVLEWYGAVAGHIAFKPIGVGPVGSFGKPLPDMEMKVVDEHDRDCPRGESDVVLALVLAPGASADPDATVGAMNAAAARLGAFTPAPASALRFWLLLATGYMVLMTAQHDA